MLYILQGHTHISSYGINEITVSNVLTRIWFAVVCWWLFLLLIFGWIAQVAGSRDEDMAKCWSSLPIETGASSLSWTLIFGIFLLNAHPSLSRINSCIRSQHKVLNTPDCFQCHASELNVLEISAGHYACVIFIYYVNLKGISFLIHDSYCYYTSQLQSKLTKQIADSISQRKRRL